jgi:hypothetical protein
MMKYKYHLLLVLMALLWISAFDFLTQMSLQNIIYPDSNSYRAASENLYIFYRGDNYRPILMAAIFGIPYLFGFGDTAIYTFSFYVNLFCWIGSVLVFFEIGKLFLRRKTAFVLSAFSIFLVGVTAYVFHLLSENIYLLLTLSAFWFLAKYYQNRQFFYLSFSLAIFISCMLVRPGAKFFAVILLVFFIREVVANYAAKTAWLIYGSLFMVFIQCAGLRFQSGNFTITYIDAVTLYNYLDGRAIALNGEAFRSHNDIYALDYPMQKEIAAADFSKQVQTNLPNLVRAFFWDVSENATAGNVCIDDCMNKKGRSIFMKETFFVISKWQNIILTFAGAILSIYFLLWRRREWQFSLMAFFIVYTILLSGISYEQGDRFHVVTFPFALLLFAKVIQEKRKNKA